MGGMLRALARIFRRQSVEEEWLPLPYEQAILVPAPPRSQPLVNVGLLVQQTRPSSPLVRNRQAAWQVTARRQFIRAMRDG